MKLSAHRLPHSVRRWRNHIIAAIATALLPAGFATAQDQPVFETIQTVNGCLFFEHTYYPGGGSWREFRWSGACTPGQLISGAGTLTWRSDEMDWQGRRYEFRQTGTMSGGVWLGEVREDQVESENGGPWEEAWNCGEGGGSRCPPEYATYDKGCAVKRRYKFRNDPYKEYDIEGPCAAVPASAGVPAATPMPAAPPPAAGNGSQTSPIDAYVENLFRDLKKELIAIGLNELKGFFAQSGHTLTGTGSRGTASAHGKAASGLIYNVIGWDCTADGNACKGLELRVEYDYEQAVPLQKINNANLKWPALAVWYEPSETGGAGGTVGISRYLILEGGLSAGNLKANLDFLLSVAPQVDTFVAN